MAWTERLGRLLTPSGVITSPVEESDRSHHLGHLERDPPPDADDRLRDAVEAAVGASFTKGNRITVLKNGDEIFPAMLEAIASAQRSIDFVTFVY